MGDVQLLRQRLPVSVETTVSVGVVAVEIRSPHDDGVQIPDPVRMHAWTGGTS